MKRGLTMLNLSVCRKGSQWVVVCNGRPVIMSCSLSYITAMYSSLKGGVK